MSLTRVTRTVVDSISSFFNINNTTGAVTSVIPDLMPSNSTLYPSFACRAWVNFNGTVGADITGTYSQSAFTITVSISNHNYIQGHSVRLTFQSGTASAEIFTVTSIVDSNTFTVTSVTSRTTSGNCTATRRLIRGSGNVSNVSYNGTGDYTVNFTTALPDVDYSALYTGRAEGSGIIVNEVNPSFPAKTTRSIRIVTFNSSFNQLDAVQINVGIFR